MTGLYHSNVNFIVLYVSPQCIDKFSPTFPYVDWEETLSQCHSCVLDRHAADFSWKVAHGVPYTAHRLVSSFNYDVISPVFCYLLVAMRHVLWLARNNWRFRGIFPSALEAINSIKARLREFLLVLFDICKSSRSRRTFESSWCANGFIARVTNDHLEVTI
ncbi:uncharacterized protein LOC116617777 [Nematostella vectensis]|uniref:uncharacterized protein LOC116617777 n=1 Tax=Nematostella vectensis TaxID=45351 RepID=UPI0020777EE7|nr:uncharacterized protein LOC116617777 [Nematostella vectensis]